MEEKEVKEEEKMDQGPNNCSLPMKSQSKYTSVYANFNVWRKEKNLNTFSENVLLTYFTELSKRMKPSSLWAQYSMLKATINSNDSINIGEYKTLSSFLKKQASGFRSKQSKILSAEEIWKFVNEAPDEKYLATKVALILGVTGACRKTQFTDILIDDIKDFENMMLINLPNAKDKNHPQVFAIQGQFYQIIKKYKSLRPKHVETKRFFLNYQNGKCTSQVIGKNKFGSMPKQIAQYLGLPQPQEYTGHSFRRTSATLSIDDDSKSDSKRSRHCKPSGERALSNQITKFVNLHPLITSITNYGVPEIPLLDMIKTEEDEGPSTSIVCEPELIVPDDISIPESTVVPVNGSIQTNEISNKKISLQFANCSNIVIHVHK